MSHDTMLFRYCISVFDIKNNNINNYTPDIVQCNLVLLKLSHLPWNSVPVKLQLSSAPYPDPLSGASFFFFQQSTILLIPIICIRTKKYISYTNDYFSSLIRSMP